MNGKIVRIMIVVLCSHLSWIDIAATIVSEYYVKMKIIFMRCSILVVATLGFFSFCAQLRKTEGT